MEVNIRSFKQKLRRNRKSFRSFLTKLDKNPPVDLYKKMLVVDKLVWAEVDCLTCGNCCKKMTPTFTPADLKRISRHLKMTVDEFKAKWLRYDKKADDWQNVKQPCQFLDLSNNLCSIYPVRPADCSGFPHFTKKNPALYIHVHKQNIDYCPATYKMVEKLQLIMANPQMASLTATGTHPLSATFPAQDASLK